MNGHIQCRASDQMVLLYTIASTDRTTKRTSQWLAVETLCCVGPLVSVPLPVSRCVDSTGGSTTPSSQVSGSVGHAIGYAPVRHNITFKILFHFVVSKMQQFLCKPRRETGFH